MIAFMTGCFILPAAAASTSQEAGEAAVDDENPRHVVFDHPVIEYLSISPRAQVREIGDRARPPETDEAVVHVYVRNLGGQPEVVRLVSDDEVAFRTTAAEPRRLNPGESLAIEWRGAVEAIPYNAFIVLERDHQGSFVECDRAAVQPRDALRIGLLIESSTLEAGDARFGSFVRRMRRSLEDLHDFFDDTASTIEGESRDAIRDRFRIEFVQAYHRDDLPPMFWNHPDLDLVIACDESGPLGGFYLPAYSIGHNFFHRSTRRGLWSQWGEQALWHELLHFRGVPDYYIYPIPAGAMPGRAGQRIELPRRYGDDIMNSPYRDPPLIGALTAMVANSKHAVARVGACEDVDHEFGHMWLWVPRRLTIELVDGDGREIRGATLRIFRSRPAGLADARVQRVSEDQVCDLEQRTDASGRTTIEGEYLGPLEGPRHERSLWLLVEVEYEGEVRFDIIWGLLLNERYARGDREETVVSLSWPDLRAIRHEE